jgi:hypothetical protein
MSTSEDEKFADASSSLQVQIPSTIEFLQIDKMGESTNLTIASHLKLKGASNYNEWRSAVEDAIQGSGLKRWIREGLDIPEEVDIFSKNANPEQAKLWTAWENGDGRAKVLIKNSLTIDCVSTATDKKTALEMWQALEHKYNGTGEVLLWNCIEDYCRIDYDAYNDINKFLATFT